MSGYMKINMELFFEEDATENTEVEIKINSPDINIHDVIRTLIKPALIGVGYPPQLVEECFGEDID